MIAKTKDVFSRNAGAHPTVERGRLATGRGHLRTNIFIFYFFFSFSLLLSLVRAPRVSPPSP